MRSKALLAVALGAAILAGATFSAVALGGSSAGAGQRTLVFAARPEAGNLAVEQIGKSGAHDLGDIVAFTNDLLADGKRAGEIHVASVGVDRYKHLSQATGTLTLPTERSPSPAWSRNSTTRRWPSWAAPAPTPRHMARSPSPPRGRPPRLRSGSRDRDPPASILPAPHQSSRQLKKDRPMLRREVIILAAALLATCVIGGLLTANSHGFENVLSNIFFFGQLLLALFLIVAGAIALIRTHSEEDERDECCNLPVIRERTVDPVVAHPHPLSGGSR